MGAPTIYADYQATTPVDSRVLEAMEPFWRGTFGNPHSGDHAMGWLADDAVQESARLVSALIGADPAEITFTSGATEANNLALLGLARRAPSDRRRMLVSATEHKSVLAAAQAASDREGFSVEIVPVDSTGAVRLDELRKMIDETVLAVSLAVVNNEVGTIQDIPSVAAVLQPFDVLLHCDAAQAPSAVETLALARHADLLSLSGHKMYAPKGIGALFIRTGLRERIEPLLYGGGQQGGLRAGTVPVPLCVGMGVAADILRQDGAAERCAIADMRDSFVEMLLQSIPRTIINGPQASARHPGNANVRFGSLDAQDLLAALQPGLAASTGAACASGVPEPSHVLSAMGLNETEASASVRFSFGRFSTSEDVAAATRLVGAAVTRLARGV